jgi:hypothetical protein
MRYVDDLSGYEAQSRTRLVYTHAVVASARLWSNGDNGTLVPHIVSGRH